MISDTLRRQRFIADQFRSGDIRKMDAVLQDLMQDPDSELISGLLSGAYVDITGVLWVPPDFAVNRSKQAAVDYGFWQLLGLAPEEACMNADIDRSQINAVKFRSYSETLRHPDDMPACYGENITRMEKFPDAIFNFPALEKIDARDTAFTLIPETIGNSTSLKSFSLAFFKGRSIPDSMSQIKTLEELQFIHCDIEKWPDYIARLPNLQFLKISSCKFNAMPADIKLPVSAEVIHLDNINLQTFPEAIFDCTGLRELSLLGNSINEIPYRFDKLPSLERINLKENPVALSKEKTEPISHLIVRGTRTSYLRTIAGESAFRSSFSADGIAEIQDFSPDKENLFPYRHPGLPPDDIAPAVGMISGMFSPSADLVIGDFAVFAAGMRLLDSIGADAMFTEYCLSAIPIDGNGILTINEINVKHLTLLFDFLIENPERSLCSEGSWRYALQHATIPVSSGDFDKIAGIFPNLRTLKLNLNSTPDVLTNIQLSGKLRPVQLKYFRGKSMEFEGPPFKAKELVIRDSTLDGCLKIKNLKGLEKIFIHNSALSRVEITDCPDLIYVEYNRQENHDYRVTSVRITGCPKLHEMKLRQIRLSGLELIDLPALRRIFINGRCTNTDKYVVNGCDQITEVDMNACRLHDFPAFITKMHNLELLRMRKCYLTDIGKDLVKLKNLRTLDISGNMLTVVPESVCNLSSLEILHLGYQGKNLPTKSLLQSLPIGLNKLTSLKYVAVLMPELKLRKIATQFRNIRLPLTNKIAK
jgi:Leucine-rich repeat (LRR) protein